MNKQIQRLGIAIIICYLAVFVKLQQTQVLDVDRLSEEPTNYRPTARKLNRPRGVIVAADGTVVAQSIDSRNDNVPRLRTYPEGELFGHVTGHFTGRFGSSGVEQQYNAELAGDTFEQQVRGITDLFSTKENVGNVTLTIPKGVQQAARDAVGDKQGTVVAIDPRSGDILAFWSNPSYNPQWLNPGPTQKDQEFAQLAYDNLNKAPGKPMLAKQYQERWPPGSTFKVVTAGVGLQNGKVRLDQPLYPTMTSITVPPQTQPIGNFGGQPCGGNLVAIMTVSCNTAFVQMALDIGAQPMIAGSEKFGFNQKIPIDLPGPVAVSQVQEDLSNNSPELGKTGIGQQDTSASPLQMALVAAAAGNGGVIMEPHVMKDIRTSDNEVVREYPRKAWQQALSPDVAATLREAMKGPTGPGGSAAGRIQVPQPFEAFGKTGTAQTGDADIVHTWFISFVAPPGQQAHVAVAVVVPNQPNMGESTGGQIAAPIANQVLNAALAYQAAPELTNPLGNVTTTTTPAPGSPANPGGAGGPVTTTTGPRRNG